MAIFTESRVIDTAQGPLTITAVYDSDTYQIEWTVTTANGITATYTDNNQLRGINGADRFALSRQLVQQGVGLTPLEASALDLTAPTLGRNVIALSRESISAAQSAGQDAQAAAPQGPTAPPPQVATADGAIVTPVANTQPSNAVVPVTTDTGGGDSGTNAPIRSLIQTQAIVVPSTDSEGRNIGIPLPAEDGTVGAIRRSSEDGSLYDSGAPTVSLSPGIGAQDDATGVDEAVARNAREDAYGAYGGASAEENRVLTNATQAQTNIDTSSEASRIVPQPNILDRFSSYTYRVSWYLMTPKQYRQLVVSKKKQVNGYQLLMQSGGAPANSGGARGAASTSNQTTQADLEREGIGFAPTSTLPTGNDADAGRNPFFPQDFYFDSIQIENLILGNGSRAAHNASNIKFTVVEPGNISLLDRLYEAVQDFIPAAGQPINYTAITYLMVIRFYGYDENGNLVTNIGAPDRTGKSDPNAVIEKFIPFRITKCDWTIENKLVSYNFEGAPAGLIVAAGTRRGTVPYDVQLTAKTLGDLLSGDSLYSALNASPTTPGASTTAFTDEQIQDIEAAGFAVDSPPAPAPATAAPSSQRNLTQGLMGALNDFQQQLVKDGIYEYADTYKLIFASGGPGGGGTALEKAKLIPPGSIKDKKNVPMPPASSQDVRSADPEKILSDIASRSYTITAGMQIVQAIDMAIRNSEFIYNQQTKFFPENNDPDTPQEQSQSGTGRDVVWYNINMTAVQKDGQYDKKRNDFAYDITFTINTYVPMNFNSNFFPINGFRGLHKSYPYWFTGQNTQVLEYKENLNNLYNLTISGSATQRNILTRQKFTSSMRDQPYYNFQSASSESRQGVSGRENEPGSNLAENLYDPVGLANCKIKIVGDPAWIQQGSVATGVDPKNFQFSAFLPDGTINFDARQILFEVAWQRPQDYDLSSGLADPYAGSSKREPIQSRIYTATKCTTMFERGSFTQQLEGLLYYFMRPDAKNKAPTAPVPNSLRQADVRQEAVGTPAAERVGNTGTLSSPAAPTDAGSVSPGTFNSAPPTPADQVGPAAPATPATSNGDVDPSYLPGADPAATGQPVEPVTNASLNINALPGAEEAGIAVPVPRPAGRITAQELGVDDVEVDASGNRTIRITVTGVGNPIPSTVNAPQDISRDY